MSCCHHYIEDPDLVFLKDVKNADLKILVDILTLDGDGNKRDTEELTPCLKIYNNDYEKAWQCIAAELQLFGGDTIMNKKRGKGVPYKEILHDVCSKFNVKDDKNIYIMEQCLLENFLAKYLKGKDAKFISEITRDMDIEDKTIAEDFINSKFMGRAIITSSVAFVTQKVITRAMTAVAISIATKIAASRSMWQAFLILIGQRVAAPIWLGPLGWVIGALLTIPAVTGPAYRITIPACLAITALRRKYHDDLFEKSRNIMDGRN